jgi:Fe-S cluster assembly iron-binding protein IscA
MLTLTNDAAVAIQHLVSDQPGAGLRISPQSVDGSELQLGLSVVVGPAATDEVIDEQGCRVFVDEQVTPLLDGKTLDVQTTVDERGVAFTISS